MSSRRSKLFNYLRVFFFCDLLLFLVVVLFWFWMRRDRSRLLDTVERQLAINLVLSSDLSQAYNYISNIYFRTTMDFSTNILQRFSFLAVSNNTIVSSSSLNLPSSVSPSIDELPPVTFSGYFEIDRVPYIRVRNTSFRQGDLLLGYPIQAISPDVVQYRDKFYKVDEVKSQ